MYPFFFCYGSVHQRASLLSDMSELAASDGRSRRQDRGKPGSYRGYQIGNTGSSFGGKVVRSCSILPLKRVKGEGAG